MTEASRAIESPHSPQREVSSFPRAHQPFLSPTRSNSFTSPTEGANAALDPRSHSFHGFSRRIFDVDGTALPHWDKSNFQPERDESCRVVYRPKEGCDFFQKNLRQEDYLVLRRSTMEQPFFSKYNRFYPKKGHFCCKACGNPLYSHAAKLKREDGWPAFGACVDGAIGIITLSEQKEIEERKRAAAIRIQAFVRGSCARATVSEKIGLLIEKVTELQRIVDEQLEKKEDEEYEDEMDNLAAPATKRSSRASLPLFTNLSLHSLHEFCFSDGNSSSSSFASFEDDSDTSDQGDSHLKDSGKKHSRDKLIASFAASAAVKRSQYRVTKEDEAQQWNELLVEIHCHRCKSHLGNIFEEENRGRDGITKYKERHRVNGRALKFVEDNLPKRIVTNTSLLFANQSQRRLMGLKPAEPALKEPEFLFAKPRNKCFISPRSKKKKVTDTFQSPVSKGKPGVGIRGVSFQSPIKSPSQRQRISLKQKQLEDFFLSRSVH